MELLKVENENENNITIYENEITQEIAILFDMLEIEDKSKITHSQFNYILSKVGKKLFYDNKLLKNNPNISNKYNFKLLTNILYIYIDTCYLYNKIPSIEGYSLITNIEYQVIHNWKYEKTNSEAYAIFEKIANFREAALKNKCVDSSNIIGTITIGNNENGWNMPGSRITNTTNNIITSDSLPLLQASKNQNKIDKVDQ